MSDFALLPHGVERSGPEFTTSIDIDVYTTQKPKQGI